MPKTLKKQRESQREGMTFDQKSKRTIEAFLRLGRVWNRGRQGIITSFNGVRVGKWRWDTNRMIINALDNSAGNKFRKILRQIQSEGVMKTEVQPRKEGTGTIINMRTTELSKLSPGELDPIMKSHGYFVIDSNLPVLREGEEGATIPNPQSEV
jgi:hypothetical protein